VAEAVIRVSASPGERRVALMRGRLPYLVAVERPAYPDAVGDLHRARVSEVSRAMSGAFLTMAGGVSGFLPDSEAPDRKAVHEGAMLMVRVMRAAQGGKGPRLTARLSSEECADGDGVALLRRGPEAALRCAALAPGAPVLCDSHAEVARLRPALGPRVSFARDAFGDDLENLFDLLAGQEVPLPGGGRLTIHPTPALTAMDVDTGAQAAGDAAAALRLNHAAVAEAARQIRLRDLGGAIVLDVAGLTPKQRAALAEPLAAALREDPLKPKLLGLTRLGLFEIQRRRVHPPLHEVLGLPPSPLTHGLAALRRAMREESANPGRALTLRAAPAVIAAIQAADAARDLPRLGLVGDPARAPGEEALR
jgi:Ribonuclease G/E